MGVSSMRVLKNTPNSNTSTPKLRTNTSLGGAIAKLSKRSESIDRKLGAACSVGGAVEQQIPKRSDSLFDSCGRRLAAGDEPSRILDDIRSQGKEGGALGAERCIQKYRGASIVRR